MAVGVYLHFHTRQVALADYITLFFRELVQHSLYAPGEGVYWCGRLLVLDEILRKRDNIFCKTHVIGQRVTRNLEEPRTRMIDIAKAVALVHGIDEDLLQKVFSQMAVRQAMNQVALDFRLVLSPRIQNARVARILSGRHSGRVIFTHEL